MISPIHCLAGLDIDSESAIPSASNKEEGYMMRGTLFIMCVCVCVDAAGSSCQGN